MNAESGLEDKPHEPLPYHCPNCGHSLSLTAQYCPMCGQKIGPSLVPLKSLLGEFIGTVFNLDSSFFRTLLHLFNPGFLTTEFFKGRHKSYYRPLRLFFVTLVILYAVLGFEYFREMDIAIGQDSSSIEYFAGKQALEEIDNLKLSFGYDTLPEIQRAFVDSLSAALTSDTVNADINIRHSEDSVVKLTLKDIYELEIDSVYQKYDITGFRARFMTQQLIRAIKEPGKAVQSFITNTSWMIILLMPALAGIMKLLYLRSQRFYIEHLIFLFHYHAAVFTGLIIYVLLMNILPAWCAVLVTLLCLLFLLIAMKAYYRQGWLKTTIKCILLLLTYFSLLLVFIGFTLVVSLVLFH